MPPGTVSTTLNFLCYLQLDPVSYNVYNSIGFKVFSGTTTIA